VVVKLSPNKRTSGRARKNGRRHSEAGVRETGPEQKVFQQKAERPVEMESDEEKTEPEFKKSEPELIMPAHLEPQRQPVEHIKSTAEQLKPVDVKPASGQKSGGKRVAENREGAFETFTKINESVFSLEGVKKAAAWYIETSEKLANQALELQEKATGWAKDTPFAPLFEAQHSIARKFVERSANAARSLWQLPSN
jgi:hypothetical protein